MSKEIIYYCEQGDPYCNSPKCRCNTIRPKEEPFKHEFKVLSKEEVMEERSSAYEFIDFDKQETLEEAAKNYRDKVGYIKSSELENQIAMLGFKEGAKWQSEKMYSEEEVENIIEQTIEKFYKHFYTSTKAEMKGKWFEQFKKK